MVFELLTLSCITVGAMDSLNFQRSCAWAPQGLYAKIQDCESDGNALIGRPVFSDVADGRKIERSKCDIRTVK